MLVRVTISEKMAAKVGTYGAMYTFWTAPNRPILMTRTWLRSTFEIHVCVREPAIFVQFAWTVTKILQQSRGGHYTLKNTKIKIATLNKHCSASVDTMNFVLHNHTHKNILYGHLEFHGRRSNSFRENGRQSWNIQSNVHFLNGSQSANIDRMNLAEEHIWDLCMCKRTCNFRTSGPNSYKNIAWRSGGGHYTLKNTKTAISP